MTSLRLSHILSYFPLQSDTELNKEKETGYNNMHSSLNTRTNVQHIL